MSGRLCPDLSVVAEAQIMSGQIHSSNAWRANSGLADSFSSCARIRTVQLASSVHWSLRRCVVDYMECGFEVCLNYCCVPYLEILTSSFSHRFFLTTSKDMTGRLYTLYPVEGYRPKTFAGHRDAVLNAYFSADHKSVCPSFFSACSISQR